MHVIYSYLEAEEMVTILSTIVVLPLTTTTEHPLHTHTGLYSIPKDVVIIAYCGNNHRLVLARVGTRALPSTWEAMPMP